MSVFAFVAGSVATVRLKNKGIKSFYPDGVSVVATRTPTGKSFCFFFQKEALS
jgi:hypothetical protein